MLFPVFLFRTSSFLGYTRQVTHPKCIVFLFLNLYLWSDYLQSQARNTFGWHLWKNILFHRSSKVFWKNAYGIELVAWTLLKGALFLWRSALFVYQCHRTGHDRHVVAIDTLFHKIFGMYNSHTSSTQYWIWFRLHSISSGELNTKFRIEWQNKSKQKPQKILQPRRVLEKSAKMGCF